MRQVFFSFHYDNDAWRAGEIRNMGVVEDDKVFSDNGWESVRTQGDERIKEWIKNEMNMRTCAIVLIGSETASRYWVQYEIKQAWKMGKGVVGIYVNKIEDQYGHQSRKGRNPFNDFYIDKTINYIAYQPKVLDNNDIKMSMVCKTYDSPYVSSTMVYKDIKNNIESMIEEAIEIRNQYPK